MLRLARMTLCALIVLTVLASLIAWSVFDTKCWVEPLDPDRAFVLFMLHFWGLCGGSFFFSLDAAFTPQAGAKD